MENDQNETEQYRVLGKGEYPYPTGRESEKGDMVGKERNGIG